VFSSLTVFGPHLICHHSCSSAYIHPPPFNHKMVNLFTQSLKKTPKLLLSAKYWSFFFTLSPFQTYQFIIITCTVSLRHLSTPGSKPIFPPQSPGILQTAFTNSTFEPVLTCSMVFCSFVRFLFSFWLRVVDYASFLSAAEWTLEP